MVTTWGNLESLLLMIVAVQSPFRLPKVYCDPEQTQPASAYRKLKVHVRRTVIQIGVYSMLR